MFDEVNDTVIAKERARDVAMKVERAKLLAHLGRKKENQAGPVIRIVRVTPDELAPIRVRW